LRPSVIAEAVVIPQQSSNDPAAVDGRRSGSVVRQLDFGCVEGAAAGARLQRAVGSPAPRSQLSPALGSEKRRAPQHALGAPCPEHWASPCGVSRSSLGELLEWDSSLRSEVPQGTCLTYSPTLAELSPLRSFFSVDASVQSRAMSASPCAAHCERTAVRADRDRQKSPKATGAKKVAPTSKAASPLAGVLDRDVSAQLLRALRVGARTPRGSIMVQLRLCGCGCGVHLEPTAVASAPCSPAMGSNISPAKDLQGRKSRSPGRRLSGHGKPQGALSPQGAGPLPREKLRTAAPLARRSSSAPLYGYRSLAAPVRSSTGRSPRLGGAAPRSPRAWGTSSGPQRGVEMSLSDLQSTVRAIRARYVDRFLGCPTSGLASAPRVLGQSQRNHRDWPYVSEYGTTTKTTATRGSASIQV